MLRELEDEIRTMLALSDEERLRVYGTRGWKLLILKYIDDSRQAINQAYDD